MHSIEDIKKIFTLHKCELISDEYIDSKSSLIYKCRCGEIRQKTLLQFKRRPQCKLCLRNKFSLSYDYVKRFFADKGCELLEDVYINARTKMKYRCECKRLSYICFYSFKNGNRCKECGKEKATKYFNYTQKEAEDKFKEIGCELLDNYTKSTNVVQFKCHCGRISYSTPNRVWIKKQCAKCGLEKRRGKTNYQWREDREQVKLELKFKDKCYKIIKSALKLSGEQKSKKTIELLGYDWRELKKYIESHPNYNNVKNGKWHIDHIFPIKAFFDYKIWNIKIINALDNLQPLGQFENISKGGKYNKYEFINWLKTKNVMVNE